MDPRLWFEVQSESNSINNLAFGIFVATAKAMGKIALSFCFLAMMGCSSDSGPASMLMPDSGVAQPDTGIDNDFIPEPDFTELRSITPTDCRFEVAGNVLNKEHYCGDLTVPEDRDDPRSRNIQIHFLQIMGEKSEGVSSATMYLDDGPGGNGEGIMEHFAAHSDFLDGLLAAGDIVLLGQRGTQYSVPALMCSTANDCPTSVSLENFTTETNVADVNELRRALNYDFLNLLGISYGSRLGLEMMRQHGNRLRSVVIDGVVPPQINWYASSTKALVESVEEIERLCRNDSICSANSPNLLSSFVSTYQNLNDAPIDFGNRRINGENFATLMQALLYKHTNYPLIPKIITELSNRRTSTITSALTLAYNYLETRNASYSNVAFGLYYSVVCSELFNPYSSADMGRAIESVPSVFHSRVSIQIEDIVNRCQSWPKNPAGENDRVGVESDTPTLVISGSVDPITPPSYARVAHEGLSRSTHVVFDGYGHGASMLSSCGRKLVVEHISNPRADLDTSCSTGHQIPIY